MLCPSVLQRGGLSAILLGILIAGSCEGDSPPLEVGDLIGPFTILNLVEQEIYVPSAARLSTLPTATRTLQAGRSRMAPQALAHQAG